METTDVIVFLGTAAQNSLRDIGESGGSSQEEAAEGFLPCF